MTQLAKGTCISVEASVQHRTQNHKLQYGLVQQSKEPLVQWNRYGSTENKNKSFSECPVDNFSSHLPLIFMDIDYTSKKHL